MYETQRLRVYGQPVIDIAVHTAQLSISTDHI